jgi:hypothetical protein
MAAAADYTPEEEPERPIEPLRLTCQGCGASVFLFLLNGRQLLVEPHEWEPRAACYVCATIEGRGQSRRNCYRCGGTGYVGSNRPAAQMLGVDIAWSDEGHVRLVGPKTNRRRGEGLYPLHHCR